MKHGKKRKKSRFWILKKRKKRKNVEVTTYRSKGLKTTVTTPNSFVVLHAITKVICGAYFNQQ